MAKSTKKFALGAVFAAAAGFLAGILSAPKSGKDTRTDIKNAATASVNEAEKQLKKLNTQLTDLLNEGKKQVADLKGKAKKESDELMEKGQQMREKAREMLSAAHEGDAEDKDLKKAIDDVNVAIKDLKAYLKK